MGIKTHNSFYTFIHGSLAAQSKEWKFFRLSFYMELWMVRVKQEGAELYLLTHRLFLEKLAGLPQPKAVLVANDGWLTN